MKKPIKTTNYNALTVELEELLTQLESGNLEIDAAVEQYQRGIEIVKQLEVHLQTAENKVQTLKDSLESDQPVEQQDSAEEE